MALIHICDVCATEITGDTCPAHPDATRSSLVIEDVDVLAAIEQELRRLGCDSLTGDGSLDVLPTDDPACVALLDLQETTVFHAQELLAALRACPVDATLDEIWQAILPYQAEA